MLQFDITGMSCAACSSRIEKAVNKVPGVTSCSVSLLTNSMGVEGSASPKDIIAAVVKAGYGAKVKAGSKYDIKTDTLTDTETPKLRRRLIASLVFLAVLMYFSMGHMMGLPLPNWFAGNHIAVGLVQLILSGIILVINRKFFINGTKGLINRSPNMDTLVALGSGASFIWSIYALFMMTDAQLHGDASAVMMYMDELYFESAATILTLITVGKMLEARSKGRTTDALKGLMSLAPKTANVIRNGIEQKIPAEELIKGDIFVVRPGESIPADAVVTAGESTVNESALTGESIPVDKTIGDSVSAATINNTGFLTCEAKRVGEDTVLSQIIRTVTDAAATKAPIAKIADKVSGVFVPVVIAIAVITAAVWMFVSADFGYSLARGIAVLVISCPCALGLATPVAIMVGSGAGAKNGILFKTAASLEQTGRTQIVALDKTGTITKGEPKVTDIIAADGTAEDEFIRLAVSLEAKSNHPLAKAVTDFGKENSIEPMESDSFITLSGSGLTAKVQGRTLYGGNLRFISEKAIIQDSMKSHADKLSAEGKTPLFFSCDGNLIGIIAVADTIKEDSPEAIAQLKEMGMKVVMLTGDNERTASAIGKQAGVDDVIAGVLPDGKEAVVRSLMKQGKVAMVGDGINDAPALTAADIGIAIGAGSDIAIDAADIVLMKNTLADVPAAIRLSGATLRNIHQNLFWAFIYNIIGIPLAAGCLTALGLTLNPMFAAAAMSLSSFCVVTNALRLNFFRPYNTKYRHKAKPVTLAGTSAAEKSVETVTVINIKGMMCEKCELHINQAIEAIPQVISVVASHTEGTATVKSEGDLPVKQVKKAIEKSGYKVI